jgi:hypothetical protein
VLHKYESAIRAEEVVRDTAWIQERIRRGVWHDPRLGAIAGGGVIAELGVGDEPFGERDEDFVSPAVETDVSNLPRARREHNDSLDLQAANALPIVVLKNYTSGGKVEVMDVLAKWAAALVDGQVRYLTSTLKTANNEMMYADRSCRRPKS